MASLTRPGNDGAVIQVIGTYASYAEHVRGKDLHLGKVLEIKSWKEVPQNEKRGVWQIGKKRTSYRLKS